MYRCNEPGWKVVAVPDGKRGLWYRYTEGKIELCAGKDGDGAYFSIGAGETVSVATVSALADVLGSAHYSASLRWEQVMNNHGDPPSPADWGTVRAIQAEAMDEMADTIRDMAKRMRGTEEPACIALALDSGRPLASP